MPPFHYHIKIELYATPDPKAGTSTADQIWVPSPSSTIFDDLPSHPARRQPLPTPPDNPAVNSKVIDCGRHRGTPHDADDNRRNIVHLSERQWQARAESAGLPKIENGLGPNRATRDWRFGRVNIESFDTPNGNGKGKMADVDTDGEEATNHIRPAAPLGLNLGGIGHQTKARYIPLETKNTEVGWGIVHLYREADEASAMATKLNTGGGPGTENEEDEGTILCIPAVPRYMDSRRFLAFMGDHWRAAVSHFRMIMTSSMDKYMVLMRFRDPRRAREWRKEFDGKPFDDFTDLCHVTFIKSITVETPNQTDSNQEGSKLSPLAPNSINPDVINNLRPFPPPTPNLVELPTCAVCLERMDDTAGLMTILCQHVFHCTCLQTWKNGGCPICRATTPKSHQEAHDPSNPYSKPFGQGVSNLCSVCDSPDNLWICLICGNVGCGRYERGHAKEHWKETSHTFSLELETQHVWDYGEDRWVHRLIRNKGDGKIVELPSNSEGQQAASRPAAEDTDVVPRSKIEGIGLEYTHLLTSQLESQRQYFEDLLSKAVDKAAKAAASAESTQASIKSVMEELAVVKEECRILKEQTVPSLEKEFAREKTRATKSADLARNMSKSLQEEKEVSAGLLTRIEHMKKEHEKGSEENKKLIEQLRQENEELKEMNQDLTMFVSGQERLKEMQAAGEIEEGDLEEGTVGVAEGSKKKRKGKKK